MQRVKIIIIILLSIGLVSCNKDSQVIATFDGGTVTRKELKNFYNIKEVPMTANYLNLKTQMGVIDNIAFMKIIEKEQEKKNLFSSEEYKNLFSFVEKQQLATVFKNVFIEKAKDEKELELANIQFALIKNPNVPMIKGNPIEPEIKNKSEKIFSELNSKTDEKEIFQYISNNTEEEGRKCLGGLLEPYCINCGNNPFSDVFKEGVGKEDKKFYLTQSEDGNFYIYRILDIKKVKSASLEKHISSKFKEFKNLADTYIANSTNESDKKHAEYFSEGEEKLTQKSKMMSEFFLKQFSHELWMNEYEKIKKNSGLVLHEGLMIPPVQLKPTDIKDTDVLFTTKESKFTLQDLNNEFEKVNIFKNDSLGRNMFHEKINFLFSSYIPAYLIGNLPEASSIKNSDEYKNKINSSKSSIAFSFFQRDIQNSNVQVTEQEIKDTYEAGKMYAYSKPSEKNPEEKIPLSYEEVKESIRSELFSNKMKSRFNMEVEALKKNYHLQIEQSLLKEGEI